MTLSNHSGVELRIRGKVQGVGFRPFVWQLAQRLQLHGDVCNDGDGVVVRLLEDAAQFIAELHQHCPPLARIDSVESAPFVWQQRPADFSIRQSAGGTMNTQIVPDAATCPECLAEMNTPVNAVIVTLLSTVPTAARASPLFAQCRMTVRLPSWLHSRCAHNAMLNITIRMIVVFMPSLSPARRVARIWRG